MADANWPSYRQTDTLPARPVNFSCRVVLGLRRTCGAGDEAHEWRGAFQPRGDYHLDTDRSVKVAVLFLKRFFYSLPYSHLDALV